MPVLDRPPGNRLTRRELLGLVGAGQGSSIAARGAPLRVSSRRTLRSCGTRSTDTRRETTSSSTSSATKTPTISLDPTRERGSREGAGWLLVELYDGSQGTSSLANLDPGRITDGPVARVLLDQHVPISFHGYWRPGEGAAS